MSAIFMFVQITLVVLSSFGVVDKQDQTTEKITGIYSDMRYNEEGGDVLGCEIFIVYSKDGFYVIFQSSEGEPEVPVIARAKVKASEIQFSLRQHGQDETFKGAIKDGYLIGSFTGGDELRLKRKKSYWQ
jgi:hypothetical protein